MKKITEGQIRYRKYRDTYIAYGRKYKSGKTENNSKYYFGGNKIKVLERDGYKCVKCGMTDEEHKIKWKRGITVDHIDGKGRNSKIKNNNLDNLRTLCLSCHGRIDVQRCISNKRKPIQSSDYKGRIKKYPSIVDAAREIGRSVTTLNRCLKGENKHCKNMTWRYL